MSQNQHGNAADSSGEAEPGKISYVHPGRHRDGVAASGQPATSAASRPAPPVFTRPIRQPVEPDPETAGPVIPPAPAEDTPAAEQSTGSDATPTAAVPPRRRRTPLSSDLPEFAIDPWEFTDDVDVFAASDGSPSAVETEDGIKVSWLDRQTTAKLVVYVVAASDQGPVEVLDQGERLAATTHRSVLVSKSAGPYFGVFTFEGSDIESAKQAVGAPHGMVMLLREVREVTVQALASVVQMRWRKPEEVASVRVLRSRPNAALPEGFRPELLMPGSHSTMFQDENVEPGARYTYRIYSISSTGQRSAGVTRIVTVPEEPIAVVDLQAEVRELRKGSDPSVDLTYTPPRSGKVTIYASLVRPKPVSDDQLFDQGMLTQLALGEQIEDYPIGTDDGLMLIPQVMYSTAVGPSRYYTPVTFGDSGFRVGRTAVVHYIGRPREPEILDRVDWQLLRFRWPAGAETVGYRLGARGAVDPETAGPEQSLSRANYDRDGGIKLSPLPDRGATLFVRGKLFDVKEHAGAWVSVNYPGRIKLTYGFAPGEGKTVSLLVWSERPLSGVQALVRSHPTAWLRDTGHKPPGTVDVARVDWPHPVPAGIWTPIGERFILPAGRARAFFYLPDVATGETLMVVDPLPVVERSRRPGIAEAAEAMRTIWERTRTRDRLPEEESPSYAQCPTCFERYAEDQVWVRCGPTGSCETEADDAQANLTRRVLQQKPVRPVSAEQTMRGGPVPCPTCGTLDSEVVCPHCHFPLPSHWNSDRAALYLTFVGATMSGKTTFLAVLLEQLRLVMQPRLNRLFQSMSSYTQRRAAEYRARLFEEGTTDVGTKPLSENPDLLLPLVFDTGPNPNGQPAALVLYDVSGEDLETEENTARYGHMLSNTDCLIFLVDILQLDSVRQRVRGLSDGLGILPAKVAEPTQVLMNVANVIRQRRGQYSGPVDVRVAIALAKFDVFQLGMRDKNGGLARFIAPGSVLMRDPYAAPQAPTGAAGLFYPADSLQMHLEARDLLERLDAREFLNALDTNFTDYRFFAVSALGHQPLDDGRISDSGVSTFRLTDMVRWVMSERWYG